MYHNGKITRVFQVDISGNFWSIIHSILLINKPSQRKVYVRSTRLMPKWIT